MYDPQKQRPSWEFSFLGTHKFTAETHMNIDSEWFINRHTHIQRNACHYKQAMKTGKHEDKPQVFSQLLSFVNLLRDY